LKKKNIQVEHILEKTQQVKNIMKDVLFIAFESPHRINKTLEIIEKVLPESEVIVTRELTKKFEEIYRGKASELKDKEFRGEITLIIS
jgi:16S rRNA (cytidine1402-2'-O)-methyltransferase